MSTSHDSAHQLVSMCLAAVKADAVPNSVTRLLDAIPLMLAALYYLFAPFFLSLTCRGLTDYLKNVSKEWQGMHDVPPHLTPESIAATCEWVADAPQVIPTLLLPLAAAVFAIQSQDIPAVVLAFASVVICVATLWIYSTSPLKYRSYKFVKGKYTIVAVVGVALNAAAAGFVLSR